MICSAPATKSSSTWLDRLRSNKGFDTAGDLSLDHFILHGSADSGSSVPELRHRQSIEGRISDQVDILRNEAEERGKLLDAVDGVLSDLFNAGGPCRSSIRSRKKLPRKQSSPKFCSVHIINDSGGVRDNENVPYSTPSLNSGNKISAEERLRKVVGDEAKDDDRDDKELMGYSRSELTIIDTSLEVWKVDKLVFRRKNMWKARDKKGNSRASSAGRKRRRKNCVTNDKGTEGSKKSKLSTTEARDAVDPSFHKQDLAGSRKSNGVVRGRMSQAASKAMESIINQFPLTMQSNILASKGTPGRENYPKEGSKEKPKSVELRRPG